MKPRSAAWNVRIQRSAVHHLRHAFQPLRDLDVVYYRVDRRERAQDPFGPHARLEGRIALRVECLGLRHSAGHPQDDDGIRSGFRPGCAHHLRFAAHQRRQGCCRGHSHTHKSTAAELGNDLIFFDVFIGKGPLANQLKLGRHQYRPQQVGESVGRRLPGSPVRADASSAICRSAALGARPSAYQYTRSTACGDGLERRAGWQRCFRVWRHQPVHARLPVEDEEARSGIALALGKSRCLEAGGAPEAGESLPRRCCRPAPTEISPAPPRGFISTGPRRPHPSASAS